MTASLAGGSTADPARSASHRWSSMALSYTSRYSRTTRSIDRQVSACRRAVVVAAGAHQFDTVVEYAVDESVFVRSAARPRVGSHPPERFRLADASEWVAPDRHEEIHDAQRYAWLGGDPVAQVLIERCGVDERTFGSDGLGVTCAARHVSGASAPRVPGSGARVWATCPRAPTAPPGPRSLVLWS